MFKFQTALLFIFSSLSLSAAQAQYSTDRFAKVEVSSTDQPLLETVASNFRDLRAERHETQEIYVKKFYVKDMTSGENGVCTSSGRKPSVATLEYRNEEGVLYTVAYLICVGTQASAPTFVANVIPGSEQQINEVGFKKDVWAYVKNERGENDDGGQCGVQKSVVQKVCIPSPYQVYAYNIDSNVDHSSQSVLQKTEIDSSNGSCVKVTFELGGKGYNTVAGIRTDCAEGSWFKYTIRIKGYLTGLKN